MDLKSEKGITLIALVITVVLLTIIGSMVLNITNNTTDTTKSTREMAELNMIQQLILERYTKYTLTRKNAEILVGEKFGTEIPYNKLPYNLDTLSPIKFDANMSEEKYYYLIYNHSSDNDKKYLEQLGIEDTSNIYIVNYYTGEVMQLETDEIQESRANAETDGKYVVREISDESDESDEDEKCIVLKEEKYNEIYRYVIKQTSEGELLYTFAMNLSS